MLNAVAQRQVAMENSPWVDDLRGRLVSTRLSRRMAYYAVYAGTLDQPGRVFRIGSSANLRNVVLGGRPADVWFRIRRTIGPISNSATGRR